MKKAISLLLILVLCISIAACSSGAELTEQQQLAVDTVNQFMAGKGNSLLQTYEDLTASDAGKISVANAMEYRLEDWDGFSTHFLMISLNADIAYTGENGEDFINDSVQILLDMDSGKLYDSTMLTNAFFENFTGTCSSKEEVCTVAVNAFSSYIMNNPDLLWSEMETLTEIETSAINNALK